MWNAARDGEIQRRAVCACLPAGNDLLERDPFNHGWTPIDTANKRALNRGLPGPLPALTFAPRHFNYVE